MKRQKLELIWYYRQGWRAGYVVRRGYKWVRIKRILPYAAAPRKRGIFIKIKVEDTKQI